MRFTIREYPLATPNITCFCIKKMKKLLLLSAILCFTLSAAHAQLSSTITSQIHDPSFSMGHDFWLAIPSNQWGTNGKGRYINIYITSPKKTTAYVVAGGVKTAVKITADSISTFQVPEFFEMESSGIAENKGIHVYDTNADLSVYLMSHQPYCGEGSFIIPTIGWGTDYVVAAYGGLYGGSGGYDLPSELTIVASEDNTSLEIIPSCECRQCDTGNIDGDAQGKIVVFYRSRIQ